MTYSRTYFVGEHWFSQSDNPEMNPTAWLNYLYYGFNGDGRDEAIQAIRGP